MTLDGSLFNVADTKANAQAFGRSCNQYGKGAYPQARASPAGGAKTVEWNARSVREPTRMTKKC